jgi:aspartyl/asparaginyl beta-hydroxylase (cupin superfamily)
MLHRSMQSPGEQVMTVACASHVLWFRSLFREGLALAFPCDAQGRVDMDTLSERARKNYLFARTLVGREFSVPSVELSH